ncbi:hypothetical protein Hanom_Chr00s025367g01764391 [Helianthus anomalus]
MKQSTCSLTQEAQPTSFTNSVSINLMKKTKRDSSQSITLCLGFAMKWFFLSARSVFPSRSLMGNTQEQQT